MSLALVQVPLTDFQQIHAHVSTHMPRYANMHLRQARYRNGQRVLRYLHAMYAPPAVVEIHGMISGPNLFWNYRLKPGRSQTQLQVLASMSSPEDDARIQRTFLSEILGRMAEEQAGNTHKPKRLSDQFYLLRRRPGMPVTHANCQAAIARGALDRRFVSQLDAWNFALLHP